MTELLPRLYSVSVPEESSNFEKMGKELWYYIDGSGSHFNVPIDFEFEIIGTVTADTIDFDCEPYCEKINVRSKVPARAAGFIDFTKYKNYLTEEQYWNSFNNPIASFRSLLTSKGQHFVNPYGERPTLDDFKGGPFNETGDCTAYHDSLNKWQQAEQNLVKKLVIIKKVNHV